MIAIRSFIELIIYLAIVAIIIELILPKGNTKKYVYTILSLFLLLNIISPVINIIRDIDMQEIYDDVLESMSIDTKYNKDDTVAVFAEYKNKKITDELKKEMLNDIKEKLNNMNIEVQKVDIKLKDNYEFKSLEVYIDSLDYLGENRHNKIVDIISMLEKEYDMPSNSIVITEEAK